MAKQKLGRGFDSLMPRDFDKSILEQDKNRVQKLFINDIAPNPEQPRRELNRPALDELAESIKRYGVLQPIIVVRTGNGFKIVAGERRWRAARAAKLTHIPAIVRSLEELEQVELALIENIQRVDLSPLEQALSVYRLQHQFNLSLEQIAKRLGKAPTTISNLSRLLQLPDSARQALQEGKISEGHARAVLALRKNPPEQEKLLQRILDNNWTVRQAEQYAIKIKKSEGGKEAIKPEKLSSKVALVSSRLGANVEIKRRKRGGQLIIPFQTEQQLLEIFTRLGADQAE